MKYTEFNFHVKWTDKLPEKSDVLQALGDEISKMGGEILQQVFLMQDDVEYIDGCKRIGVAVYLYDGSFDLDDEIALQHYRQQTDCLGRIYGPSEKSAMDNAKAEYIALGYQVL